MLEQKISEQRIPKIVHYAWFGGWPKPDMVLRCMETWNKYLPDYEVVEINEDNFDINQCPYTKLAYEHKKWAFITDVCRLKALYESGGLYLDTDVQVLKNLDGFLHHRAFTSFEADKWMISATLGAEKGHPWIKMLLDYYSSCQFNPAQPTPNTQVITMLSKPLIEREVYGFCYLKDGVVIYPTSYFCGFDHQKLEPIVVENSHTLHLFQGSWLNRTVEGRGIYETKEEQS